MKQVWNGDYKGKTEEIWRNTCHFIHHESQINLPGIEPDFRGEKPASNY
jgi:hypothetical protein